MHDARYGTGSPVWVICANIFNPRYGFSSKVYGFILKVLNLVQY